MGQHDKHLPKRRHLNKTVGHGVQPETPAELSRVADKQGSGTKADAKEARQGGREK